MELRFGFNGEKEKTQKEVADMLRNITKLYIKVREKNNEQNEKRHHEQNRVKKVKKLGMHSPIFLAKLPL